MVESRRWRYLGLAARALPVPLELWLEVTNGILQHRRRDHDGSFQRPTTADAC